MAWQLLRTINVLICTVWGPTLIMRIGQGPETDILSLFLCLLVISLTLNFGFIVVPFRTLLGSSSIIYLLAIILEFKGVLAMGMAAGVVLIIMIVIMMRRMKISQDKTQKSVTKQIERMKNFAHSLWKSAAQQASSTVHRLTNFSRSLGDTVYRYRMGIGNSILAIIPVVIWIEWFRSYLMAALTTSSVAACVMTTLLIVPVIVNIVLMNKTIILTRCGCMAGIYAFVFQLFVMIVVRPPGSILGG